MATKNQKPAIHTHTHTHTHKGIQTQHKCSDQMTRKDILVKRVIQKYQGFTKIGYLKCISFIIRLKMDVLK